MPTAQHNCLLQAGRTAFSSSVQQQQRLASFLTAQQINPAMEQL
jgi:hypothetical protein